MRGIGRIARSWFVLTALLTACAAPAAPSAAPAGVSPGAAGQATAVDAPRVTTPKRLVVALYGELIVLSDTARQSGPFAVSQHVESMLNVGVAVHNDQDVALPALAEAVPTIENGLWKVNPDGTMQTTYRLKPGVTWHDGVPFFLSPCDLRIPKWNCLAN